MTLKQKPLLEKDTGAVVVRAKLSDDRLRLLVDCERSPKGDKCSIDVYSLKQILKEVVDPKLLKDTALDAIAKSLAKGDKITDRLLAQGQPPIMGEDGKLQLFVKKTEPGTKSTDSRFVRELQNVVTGTIIGKVHPPTGGTDGIDVVGQVIKSMPGKTAKVFTDKSILTSGVAVESAAAATPAAGKPGVADTKAGGSVGAAQFLTAKETGFLLDRGGRLTIPSSLELGGDVDIDSGNIDYIGAVDVAKDVAKGFSITAGKDINIMGCVHGGSLISHNGSILVRSHLNGAREYRIAALGNVSAEAMQNVRVEAVGDIAILKDALECDLKCLGAILMPKGHLLGGKAQALYGVEAEVIGSTGESNTKLKGFTSAEVEQMVNKLTEELAQLNQSAEGTKTKLAPFLVDAPKYPALGAGEISKLNQALAAYQQAQVNIQKVAVKLNKLRYSQGQVVFRVNYQKNFHKGSSVSVGEAVFTADRDLTGPGTIEFREADKKFNVTSFKPLQIPKDPAALEAEKAKAAAKKKTGK